MTAFLAIALVGFAIFLLGRIALNTPPETLARWLRKAGPLALIAAGGGLMLIGRGSLGVPLVLSGLGWLRRGSPGRWTGAAGDGRRGGEVSTVRSRYLAMTLDHDSGELDGTVLAGRWASRPLASLGEAELLELRREVSGDAESLRLLEAYLDRRTAGWREGADAGAGDGLRGSPGAGSMTEQQAYEVLGLEPGATVAEIRDAHRRLMKRVHPDHGGTDFLASRINEAKTVLIDRHG